MRLGALGLLGIFVLLSGCRSRLLDAGECQALTRSVLGPISRDSRAQALGERLTRECLTAPFDRDMLSCMRSVGRFDLCREDLYRRHPERRPGSR